MFYVGIDIAKHKQYFVIINDDGLVIVHPKTIKNSEECLNKLLSFLLFHDRSQKIKIGLEAIVRYVLNLKASSRNIIK